MTLTIENILLVGSLLLFISIFVGKSSFKFGVPTLLLFLGIGMLAGTDGIGGIHFDSPKIARFIGVVSLNVILFSGGLDTRWESVKPILREGIVLSTLGVFFTATFLGLFVWGVTNFTIYESMLLGSIVSSTDAAAVFSILRSRNLGLRNNLRSTLELESGSNDPMAYVLTIAFLTLVIHQDQGFLSIIPFFLQQMLLGGIAGIAFGKLNKFVINKINLDFKGLYPVLVVSLMFITFSVTDVIGGNGFLAIYICAVYLGTQNLIYKKTILRMYDGLAWLMQIVLFLTLGLLVYPTKILPYIGIGMLISVFLIVVVRPLSVFMSLVFFKMDFKRRLYISWVGLRGGAPIVFATYPLLAGIEKADIIFNIVFFISVTSILIQGTSLTFVAKLLKVSEPEEIIEASIQKRISFKTAMKEIEISPQCSAVGKQIVELEFPRDAIIAMIKRGENYLTPSGSTIIEANDVLLILSESSTGIDKVSSCLSV